MKAIVLGCFFGDEGKGQCVNNLCLGLDPNKTIVVRFSGAHQVGHNVLHNGVHHCFHHYGSGTLQGIPTFWSERCVFDAYTAVMEGLDLITKGVKPIIYYSPLCQLVLPCDVWSQWNNAENRAHGTTGTGFKNVLDRVKAGYPVSVVDALNPIVLREKLRNVIKYYYKVEDTNLPSFDFDTWCLKVSEYVNNVQLMSMSDVLKTYSNIIFEGSQGIMLDQRFGVMPYCTPSNTTSQNVWELCPDLKDVTTYYVTRPYITRHGNGPFCTTTPVIPVEDPNNRYNDYQKSFRGCEFDSKLLKHAIDVDKCFNKSEHFALVFSHGNELTEEILNSAKAIIPNVKHFEYENWNG